jgi:hypothetical protein
MFATFVLVPLQVAPMMMLALSFERDRQWAPWAALAYPALILVAQLAARGPAPQREDAWAGMLYYFIYGQRYYFPGAIFLAVVVARAMRRERASSEV